MKNFRRTQAGATLVEILIAMLIIGLVATGIMTTFVFSRRVSWRSSTELSGTGMVSEIGEGLREAVGGPAPNGLTLEPGIYVDENMGMRPATAQDLAVLNLPPDYDRFLTSNGTGPFVNDQDGDGEPDHGDGRLVVVEEADENGNGPEDEDLDGDGQIGIDFNNDGVTDLRRVRIRVKWTSPNT